MAKRKYTDKEAIRILSQIETAIAVGSKVAKACHLAGVTDSTYYAWRKKYGHMAHPIINRMNELEEDNTYLHQIVFDITTEMQALQKSLEQLKLSS